MCAETAPGYNPDSDKADKPIDTKEVARKTNEELAKEAEVLKQPYKVGDEVGIYQQYGKKESRHAGKIVEMSETGLYKVEADGKLYDVTATELSQDKLKYELESIALDDLQEVIQSLDAIPGNEPVPDKEKYKMIDHISLVIDELVMGGLSEEKVKQRVRDVAINMAKVDAEFRHAIAMSVIKENFEARNEILRSDLTDADFEGRDIDDLMTRISVGVEDMSDAIMAQEDLKAAKSGWQVMEAANDAMAQLQEEKPEASPEDAVNLTNAISSLGATLSLGAQGVGRKYHKMIALAAKLRAEGKRADLTREQIDANHKKVAILMAELDPENVVGIQARPDVTGPKGSEETELNEDNTETIKTAPVESATPTENEASPEMSEDDIRNTQLYKEYKRNYESINTPEEAVSEADFNDMLEKDIDSGFEQMSQVAILFDKDLAGGKIELKRRVSEGSIEDLDDDAIEELELDEDVSKTGLYEAVKAPAQETETRLENETRTNFSASDGLDGIVKDMERRLTNGEKMYTASNKEINIADVARNIRSLSVYGHKDSPLLKDGKMPEQLFRDLGITSNYGLSEAVAQALEDRIIAQTETVETEAVKGAEVMEAAEATDSVKVEVAKGRELTDDNLRKKPLYKSLKNVLQSLNTPAEVMTEDKFNDYLDAYADHESEEIRKIAELFEKDLATGNISVSKTNQETVRKQTELDAENAFLNAETTETNPVDRVDDKQPDIESAGEFEMGADEEKEPSALQKRISDIVKFLSSPDGRVEINANKELEGLKSFDAEKYEESKNLLDTKGAWWKRFNPGKTRRARELVENTDALIATAEARMADVASRPDEPEVEIDDSADEEGLEELDIDDFDESYDEEEVDAVATQIVDAVEVPDARQRQPEFAGEVERGGEPDEEAQSAVTVSTDSDVVTESKQPRKRKRRRSKKVRGAKNKEAARLEKLNTPEV